MTDDRYCLYTPRDRNLEDSFSMQAATLITVGSLSNRETVEERREEGRGRKRKKGPTRDVSSPLPATLPTFVFLVTVVRRLPYLDLEDHRI